MATMDITNAAELTLMANENVMPKRFLASFFKPLQHNTRDVQIDFVNGSQKLAPFVRDGQAATISNRGGFSTRFVHCYGIELKRPTAAFDSLKRQPGEPAVVVGAVSPNVRAAAMAGRDIRELKGMTYRTLEKIISDGFFAGKYDITDAAGSVIDSIDFGRDTALNLDTLNWSQSGYKGIDSDLDDMATGVAQKSGKTATDVILGSAASKAALSNDAFLKKLDTKNLDGLRATMNVTAEGRGARLIGSVGGMRLWRYDEIYKDENGQVHTIVPANGVLVLSDALQATLHQGVVGDNDIGWFASEFAVDTWPEKDPAVQWLRVRSAMLPVIEEINATCVATIA